MGMEDTRQRTEDARTPVCKACSDTHHFPISGFMCTYCPTPCDQCRSKPQRPYCATTPCACDCHPRAAARLDDVRADGTLPGDSIAWTADMVVQEITAPCTCLARSRVQPGWWESVVKTYGEQCVAAAKVDQLRLFLSEIARKLTTTDSRAAATGKAVGLHNAARRIVLLRSPEIRAAGFGALADAMEQLAGALSTEPVQENAGEQPRLRVAAQVLHQVGAALGHRPGIDIVEHAREVVADRDRAWARVKLLENRASLAQQGLSGKLDAR